MDESPYSSNESSESEEGTKVLSLKRLAAKTAGRCFSRGRFDAHYHLQRMSFPKCLIPRVLRYVVFENWEWYAFSEEQRFEPTMDPWGSPLRRRVKFYRKLFGRIDDLTQFSDSE